MESSGLLMIPSGLLMGPSRVRNRPPGFLLGPSGLLWVLVDSLFVLLVSY